MPLQCRAPALETPLFSPWPHTMASRRRNRKASAQTDVFKGLVLEDTEETLAELVLKNGGKRTKTVAKSTTHLIFSGPQEGAKYRAAVRAGIPVVAPAWVEGCIQAGRILPEDDYPIEDEDDDDDEDGESDSSSADPPSQTEGVFEGLHIAISGKLIGQTQAEWKKAIEEHGGIVTNTVTASTTYLISVPGQKSAKVKAAQEFGIPILTPHWLLDSMEEGVQKEIDGYSLFLPPSTSVAADDDEEMEESEEEEEKKSSPPTRKRMAQDSNTRPSKKAKTVPAASAQDDDDEDEPVMTKEILKGRVPVDPRCGLADEAHVLEEMEADGSVTIWDALLNQTNIGNNNNKYYTIQLLKSDNVKGKYWTWFIWGRVGRVAGSNLQVHTDLDAAKRCFRNKFASKTRNAWDDRQNFVAFSGKYTLLERDTSPVDELEDDDDAKMADADAAAKDVKSELEPRVQELLKLICDVEAMKQKMIEIGYNAEKLPLGRLSKSHIQKGYQALKDIEEAIDGDGRHLVALSNVFYSLIPHDFGMRPPPVIRDKVILKAKLEMMEALADIEVATKLLKKREQESIHPLDQSYRLLRCDMEPLRKRGKEWNLISKMIKNTHGATHSSYTLRLLDAFNLDRHGEQQRFAPWELDQNRQLLWHGSRITNYVGIISQGLRIAPPEAPVTGYMFGKGVYFADMVSKSANYCHASKRDNVGLLLLCEVALGEPNELLHADYDASSLPPGKSSTKGCGDTIPDPKGQVRDESGCIAHTGTPVAWEDYPDNDCPSLLYNEYIVYDVDQIRMRYLVKVEFVYKD